MPVADVSLNNDWSLVRFWNYEAQAWGILYPADGFVYAEKAGPIQSTSAFTSMPMGGWFFLLLGWAMAETHCVIARGA